VPAHLAHSPLAARYVQAALEDVLGNARDYFDELQTTSDHAGWQRVLEVADTMLSDQPSWSA
jgi:hypothetical protein